MSKLSLLFKDRILSIHELDQRQTFMIGHEPHCHIHIDSLAVKPEHACISFSNNQYSITPEQNDADIFINGIPIYENTLLTDGDKIRLGKHTLIFSFNETEKSLTAEHLQSARPRAAWIQFLNGSDMGKTMPINKSMTNINHQNEYIALIANRKDGFYLSHLKGSHPPQVNQLDIGDRSFCLEDKSHISIGSLNMMFYIDERL